MKKVLREKMQELRKSFKRSDKLKADLAISQGILDLPQYPSAKRILAYYPLAQEVDIVALLEEVLSESKRLFLPRVNGDKLEIIEVKDLEELSMGSFQVMEPNSNLRPSFEEYFDLILVPGLAFSERCDRLGFGKGYYDKLLKKIRGYKIGIAYDFQVQTKIPTVEHDVKMDMVLSENGIYTS